MAEDLEFQIAEYREEVLKLNSEKKQLSANLKVEKEEHEALRDTIKGLVVENKALKVDVKDTASVLDKKHRELIKSRNETERAMKEIIKLETELGNIKLGELKKGKQYDKM